MDTYMHRYKNKQERKKKEEEEEGYTPNPISQEQACLPLLLLDSHLQIGSII